MDFIKIPFYKEDSSIGEAVIRVSSIRNFFSSSGEEVGTLIYFTNGGSMTSPMSVAKIYDLIWQTELSNQFREPTKKTDKDGEE